MSWNSHLKQFTIGLLAYLVDIALLEDLETIKCLGRKFINNVEKVGSTVNDEKTKYVIVNRRNRNNGVEQLIVLERHTFKRVAQFKYLRSIITQDNYVKV